MEIWGHRGAYHFAPENTLTGFQMAAEMGADGVEFDIQLTSDGEIVVIHDETLDRTSNAHGYVKELTLSQIKKINFNKQGITKPLFMEIPTLAEVLELLKPTRLKLNIEFKTGVFPYEGIEAKALETVKKYDMTSRIVWSSFNHYSVQKLKLLDSGAETALLCSGEIFVTGEQCEKTGAAALHPNIRQLKYPGLVEECHARGIKVRVWTVNEPEDFKLARALGADGVFTNRIDLAKG
jgi:glycerophosphoryl diester phosphodiesterase